MEKIIKKVGKENHHFFLLRFLRSGGSCTSSPLHARVLYFIDRSMKYRTLACKAQD